MLANGGSVYMRYVSVSALSVLLPADRVTTIAARGDVQGTLPNRMTARTGVTMSPSHIEATLAWPPKGIQHTRDDNSLLGEP